MECSMEKNKQYCNCSYEPCARKYKCCHCLHYHRKKGELPACYFNRENEMSYDRSIDNFIRMRSQS